MALAYKFLSAEVALRVLESKQLKVSLLSELNDIFDCAPKITAPPDEPTYTDQQWTDHVTKQNALGQGIVCLSRSYRSPLIWGHYTGSGAGLALGFDLGEISWAANPMEVKYDNVRPTFDWAAEKDIDANFVDRMLRGTYGVKATEWAYEDEARFILSLDSCEPKGGMYFAGFPPIALKQVIVGFRSQVDRLYLTRFLGRQFSGYKIEVLQSRPHPTKFEIEAFDPYKP